MSKKQLEHSLMYNTKTVDNDRQDEIEGGLFNNPMINAAIKALSIEDKEKYKKIGDDLYGTINYVDIVNEGQKQISENIPDDSIEAVLYITSQIRSGLHPVDMEVDEINLMINAYGDEWYTKWNYTKEDLVEIK
jgi:hypothetical protein